MSISALTLIDDQSMVPPPMRYVLQQKETNGQWVTIATLRNAWMAVRLADGIGGSEDSYRIIDIQ